MDELILQLKGSAQILLDFFISWAFFPASLVIVGIVKWLKKTFLDFGKFRPVMAVILGVGFGFLQRWVAPMLDLEPLQTEIPKAIMMGIATGLVSVLIHTVAKNGLQKIDIKKIASKLINNKEK